jgi:hypothetical protein
MATMSPLVPDTATASTVDADPARELTYVVTSRDGDLETGTVLLDRRAIGLMRRRPRPGPIRSFGSPPESDSVWLVDAIGWLPDANRPWDTHITSSAPTRRRAAEDLLRAYRNQG